MQSGPRPHGHGSASLVWCLARVLLTLSLPDSLAIDPVNQAVHHSGVLVRLLLTLSLSETVWPSTWLCIAGTVESVSVNPIC